MKLIVASPVGFDLLNTKICVIATFGKQLLAEKTAKIEKLKMAAKTGSDTRVEMMRLILVFDLLNVKICILCEVDVKMSIKLPFSSKIESGRQNRK